MSVRTLVATMAAVVLAGCAEGVSDGGGRGPAPRADWLVEDNAARCVEEFSVENLGRRSWAFDGTVSDVIPPRDPEGNSPEDIVTRVTFSVNRWYKGGHSDTITVLTYHAPGVVSSVDNVDAAMGARILASGEDEYLWACGFSMPYTRENARLFRRAFGE